MANTNENTATSAEISLEQTREIILLDIDAFDVQVWTNDKNWLKNVPVIVVNCWNTILAVNYPAKSFGIERRIDKKRSAAKQKCPELFVFEVPNRWGKPDQRSARLCSYEIYDCIKKYFNNCGCDQVKIDYSSKDEFYIDITELVSCQIATGQELQYSDFHQKTILENEKTITELKMFISEHNEKPVHSCIGEKRLLFAAAIAGKLLQFVKSNSGFEASAGVGVNKLQAKLACGLNKPNAVTAFMDPTLEYVSKNIKIKDINGLGGKKGKQLMQIFEETENDKPASTMTMYHLRSISQDLLVRVFGEKKLFKLKTGPWELTLLLWKTNPPKILSASKGRFFLLKKGSLIRFGQKLLNTKTSLMVYSFLDLPGLRTVNDLKEIIHNFCEELIERLEEEKSRNLRRVKTIKIILTRPIVEGEKHLIDSGSFSCPVLPSVENIFEKAMEVLENNWAAKGQPPIQEITKVKMLAKDFVSIED